MTKQFLANTAERGSEPAKNAFVQSMVPFTQNPEIFVSCFLGLTTYKAPTKIGSVLSRYTTDFEQWWRVPRPNINEW